MKALIAALFLTASLSAMATGYKPNQGATALAGAISNSDSQATGGSVGSFNFRDRLQIPVAPGLSSGSSNTTASDYKFKQDQVSTILGGYTDIEMELDIIGFLKYYGTLTDEETKKTFNLAACIESEKWQKLRKQQRLDCPR